MIEKTQVVIIGAGPTGLSMGAQLLRYNIDFIIIDKNATTTTFSKAIVVQARSLEIFSELGLEQKALNEGKITTAFNIFYKGKKKVSVNIAGLGKGLTAFPYALSLEQSKTEKLLADHLYENGQQVKWNSEFARVEQNEENVTVYYKDGEGRENTIEAKYLVGCDGAHSLVRHQLGLSFKGDTIPKMFYIADVVLRSFVINKDELYGFLIKKGFVLFFPMDGKAHFRIVGILTDKIDENENFSFADIEESIKKKIVSPVDFEKVNWFSNYKVHSRMADSFRKKRCFIAGDAAHIHTPAGGQGMNTGIQDAYNLAWKLAFVLNGNLDTRVLETYNSERMQNAKHLLKSTDRMFDVLAGTTMLGDFIRLRIFPLIAGLVVKNQRLNKSVFPLISQTGIAYPGSALTLKSKIGKVKAGDRMPYFVFSDKKHIYEFLKNPAFKLLFFGPGNGNNFELVKSLNLKVETFSFNEIPKNLFGNASDFYIFLRPDNHISYIGKDLNRIANVFIQTNSKTLQGSSLWRKLDLGQS